MLINTNLPTDYVVPGTSHSFNFLRAAGALVDIPLTIAIVGTKSAAGTAVVGNVYDATDATTTDALGGASSEGAIMCRMAYACGTLFQRGPRIKATFIAEPGGGTANVQTITVAGTATADGNQLITVAGRLFSVGVAAGTLATANATAIGNVLKAKAETLPVIISVAGAVVTLTHPTKGVNGKDVLVTFEQQVSGLTLTLATTAVGAGVADVQPALDALSPLRYEAIAIANHASADIAELLLDMAVRWAPQSKNWGHYFMFEPGTIGTATALAAAANHQSIIVGNMEGCRSAPGEGAAALAMLTYSRARPNASYDGAIVPLHPPAEATLYTPTEQNTAIKAGLTVLVGVINSAGGVTRDRAKVVQMVTSKTTTTGPSGTAPDDRNRDIAVSRVGISLAIQVDIAVDLALGAENNPDGVSWADSRPLIKDVAAAVLRAEARATPPVLNREFVEADVAAIVVQPDSTVLGRNNVRLPYHPDTPLHQVAWEHDIIVGP